SRRRLSEVDRTTPAAPSEMASHHFLDVAATLPLPRRGFRPPSPKRTQMKTWIGIVGLMVITLGGGAQIAGSQAQQSISPHQRLVNKYCVTCHNDKAKTGGITLENADSDHAEMNPELWEKAIRKLRAGLMPPSGAPRPDRATLETLRASLESSID